MEVDRIVTLGFFVRDLHQDIIALHAEQYIKYRHSDSFVVYRGQGLPQRDFDRLLKLKGGLLSFNNFLSTSLNRVVSFAYAESNQDDPDLVGVLFQITIDSSISSAPFANVRDFSYFQGEEEILFSMNSIFRIGDIKNMNGNSRLWQAELVLTNDYDPQLHALTEYIRKGTLPRAKEWYRLGQLLRKLDQFNKAQQVYEVILDQTSDENERARIYHQLGYIKNDQGGYTEPTVLHEKSIEILQKTLPPNHPHLATSYNNIGWVYDNMGEYSKALSFFERALVILEHSAPENDHDFLILRMNIESVKKHL